MAKRKASRKMIRKMKRVLAVTMVTSMIVGLTPMSVFATEEANSNGEQKEIVLEITVTEITPEVTGSGTPEDPYVEEKVDISANEAGGTTTTTTTEKEWSQGLEDGEETLTPDPEITPVEPEITVQGSETITETVVTDGKENVIEESGTSSGQETTTETTETTETKIETGQPNEEIITGETNTEISTGTPEEVPGSRTEDDDSETLDPGYAGDITVELTPGGSASGTAAPDITDLIPTEPQEQKPTEENGNTQVTVKEITDGKGNVIGYETTTVVTTSSTTSDTEETPVGEVVEESVIGETTIETEEHVEITLPERPAESEAIAEDGTVTKTMVEDILDSEGAVVGYKTTTTVVDAAGNQISNNSNSLWGTKTTTTTTASTPTTNTTTTQEKVVTTTTTVITTGITVSGEWIEATNREVTASMSNVSTGAEHGEYNMEVLGPDESYKPTDANDLRDNPNKYDPNDGGGYTWQEFTKDQLENNKNLAISDIPEDAFMLTGYGLFSDYLINRDNKNNNTTAYEVTQYELTDSSGNRYYVYCAEMGAAVTEGNLYDIINLEEISYVEFDKKQEAKDNIRAIVLNGFWGTTGTEVNDEGETVPAAGSLDAVKQLLKDAGYSDWDTLTEGQAMAATQAAIWNYGNDGGQHVHTEHLTSLQYAIHNNWPSVNRPTVNSQENQNITKLYEILIGIADTKTVEANETNIIDEKDITGASITVGEKVKDNGGTGDVYDTDVSFTLAVVPTADDTLIVQIIAGGQVVASEELAAGYETEEGKISRNADGSYTLKNVQLTEGVNITLNLNGTQHLDKGVYIYSSKAGMLGNTKDSQTFVGIAEGDQTVNLNVDLTFEVKEATAQKKSHTEDWDETETDVVTDTRTDTIIVTQVVTDVEITTEVREEAKRAWESSYKKTYKIDDDDNGGGGGSNDDDDDDNDDGGNEDYGLAALNDDYLILEIMDEDVPLGNMVLGMLPATGDISAIWMLLSLLSGFGLAGITIAEKRRKED